MAAQNFTVIDSNEKIAGVNQSELAGKWWNYAYELTVDEHFAPFDDVTDVKGRLGSLTRALNKQPVKDLLIIGGAFNLSTNPAGVVEVERSIVLPEGVETLFFPIVNSQYDNVFESPSMGGYNAKQLKALVADVMNKEDDEGNGIRGVFAKIDGQTIAKPYTYRQASEKAFSYPLVEGGIIQDIFGIPDTFYVAEPGREGEGTETPENPMGYPTIADLGGFGDLKALVNLAFADGYYMGVELGSGAHTIQFGGSFVSGGDPYFTLDVTYNILNPVYGTKGDDKLLGTNKNDYIKGKDGVDKLEGLKGDDLLVGGKRVDTLDGGAGKDELWGNEGKDKFIYNAGYRADTIFDFSDGDVVKLSGFTDPGLAENLELPSGAIATQVSFNDSDSLLFVGLTTADLLIEANTITVAEPVA